MNRYLVFRLICFITIVACFPLAVGAQITSSGTQIEFNHVKSQGHDIYSVSEVNPADSSFEIRMTVEGENINVKEMYDALFCQLDSLMYLLSANNRF